MVQWSRIVFGHGQPMEGQRKPAMTAKPASVRDFRGASERRDKRTGKNREHPRLDFFLGDGNGTRPLAADHVDVVE